MNLSRLRTWLNPRTVADEIDEELQFHIEQRTTENIAAGMPPDAAARDARRRFGNIQTVREDCREARGVGVVSDLLRDLRFGLRLLRRSPVFTAVAVVSLALGTGAATAVFAVVHGVLLRSLPVPRPQDLVTITWSGNDVRAANMMGRTTSDAAKRMEADVVTFPMFSALRERSSSVADVFGFTELPELGITVQARHEPFAAAGLMVSDNLFSALGVRPELGRPIGREDMAGGAAPVVVITHDWWLREFDRDSGVLGRALTLNGHAFTIIGVLPPDFPGLVGGSRTGFYVPLSAQPLVLPGWPLASPDRWFVRMMARLRPGVAQTRAQATFDTIFGQESERVMTRPRVTLSDGRAGFSFHRETYRTPLVILLAIVGVVVLIACANLAGLLLARGAARQHEFAVRSALGAGPWRLVRQTMTESVLIAGLGTALGIPIALWGRTAISRLLAGSPDGLLYDTSFDLAVLAFAAGAALLTALLSGSLPALRAWRSQPLAGLKERAAVSSPSFRLGRALVVAQVALSVLLVTGAGLFIRSLANLVRVNPGFATENVLLFKVSPRTAGIRGAKTVGFYDEALRALAAIPGVRAVAFTQNALLSGYMSGGTFFTLPGRQDGPEPSAHKHTVSETFFETMDIPMEAGRALRASDTEGAPKVVVVNQAFARRYFADRSAIDQVLKVRGIPADWHIVGVCRDTKYTGIKDDVPPTVYFTFRQDFISFASFALRTNVPPLRLAADARRALASVNPLVPLAAVTTQRDARDADIAAERLFASLCGALAALAVLLSCIGVFGVMAYNVERRTTEIGIRLALGATPAGVAWPVVRDAAGLAAAGIAAGVPISLVAARFVRNRLFDVPSTDPLAVAGAATLLVLVALLSAWVPARRASRVDAMRALKSE